MADERPLDETLDLFIGKTIAKMDATCCNKVEVLFTDDTKVALHIDCDSMGLPNVDTCTSCADIEPDEPVAKIKWLPSETELRRDAFDYLRMQTELLALRAFTQKVAGTCLGLALSTEHPDPDAALMGLFNEAQALTYGDKR